jgi:hypothetical protein
LAAKTVAAGGSGEPGVGMPLEEPTGETSGAGWMYQGSGDLGSRSAGTTVEYADEFPSSEETVENAGDFPSSAGADD